MYYVLRKTDNGWQKASKLGWFLFSSVYNELLDLIPEFGEENLKIVKV